MMAWKYLTLEERQKIEALLMEGRSQSFIAYQLERSKNAINCEIIRYKTNGGIFPYKAEIAQEILQKIRKNKYDCLKRHKLEDRMQEIIELLEKGRTLSDMAKILNVSKSTIFYFMQANGLKRASNLEPSLMEQRISALEMQIKILTKQIKEITHGKNN